MSQGEEPVNVDAPEVAAEKRDVKWRPVLTLLAAVALILIALHVAVTVMFRVMAKTTRYTTEPFGEAAPAAVQQLQLLRDREEKVLTSYGWVSRDDRIVHIPIERAMDLMIAEYGEAAP